MTTEIRYIFKSETELLLSDFPPHERVASLERSWRSRATPDRYQGGTSANCDQGAAAMMQVTLLNGRVKY